MGISLEGPELNTYWVPVIKCWAIWTSVDPGTEAVSNVSLIILTTPKFLLQITYGSGLVRVEYLVLLLTLPCSQTAGRWNTHSDSCVPPWSLLWFKTKIAKRTRGWLGREWPPPVSLVRLLLPAVSAEPAHRQKHFPGDLWVFRSDVRKRFFPVRGMRPWSRFPASLWRCSRPGWWGFEQPGTLEGCRGLEQDDPWGHF